MDKKHLTAPCGLDCFNCPILEDNITGKIQESMAQQLNISPGDVVCKGCKSEQGRCKFTHNCATWDCIQKKGVSFCYECNDFPCGLLAPSQ